MRIESSIISSLSELREIEQQRIADEHATIERERNAEVAARRAAEQAKLDAEEARVRGEREARLRIEQARADAEREARMRVEASEAAERARYQAALDQQRMQDELQLRRAEILQKRPRWMMAVTALAVVATVALAWVAIDHARQTGIAEKRKQEAIAATEAAKHERDVARAELAKLEQELAALEDRIQDAEQRLLVAQTDADRKRIAAEIEDGRRQKFLAKQHEADIKQALWDKKRNQKVILSEACQKNAYSKECLDAK